MTAMTVLCRAFLVTASCLALAQAAQGADYFFTFGGGYSPQGNQVSLEKNVLFFQRVLRETGRGQNPQHYLFADGNDPGRDLQYNAGEQPENTLYYELAGLFSNGEDIYNAYRSNELPDLDGGCSSETIDHYFNTTGPALTERDRLFVYYTGHGGKGEKDADHNTTLELWGHKKMRMREFVARLDKVPSSVPVVVVMVQCYSGGFSNLIFNEGDPAKGLSVHNRAGFFATVHDRTAAGCTPDIDEANYQEYSSYFWAAMHGQTRLGVSISKPDYDGDGAVSFDEAHAYALLESHSIDVSVKTSDALLRQFSSLDPAKKPEGQPEPLLTAQADYPSLLALAGPNERAVMEGLSERLGLSDPQRAAAAGKLADDFESQRKALADERKKLMDEYNQHRGSIAGVLKGRWPEFSNAWHPGVAKVLREQPADVQQAIETHEKFPRLKEVVEKISALDDQRLDLERQWARCRRLVRAIENVALAQNLPRLATPEVWQRYEALVKAEHGTMTN